MLSIERFRSRAVERGDDESHRPSTNLELLFDLVYVVAIARTVGVFHHKLAEGHTGEAVAIFAMTFFAVWWSWMGFTWFANAHDGDTVTDRLLTFVQMAGALVIAAGIDRAASQEEFTVIVVGYAIARAGLIAAWLRVARDQPNSRGRALRYAVGLVVLQLLWIARIWLPDGVLTGSFLLLVVLELLLPWWAVKATGVLPLHPGHIEERYGLFTIILLGETIAAAVGGFESAYGASGLSGSLLVMALAALAMAFACWWLYFDHPGHLAPTRQTAFRWGELHLVLFVALATMGGGLADGFETLLSDHEHASERVASMAIAIPVALFLIGLVILMLVNGDRVSSVRTAPKLGGATVVLVAGATTSPVVTTVVAAVVLVVLVTWMVLAEPDAAEAPPV